jgi:uncharacterized membrane protein
MPAKTIVATANALGVILVSLLCMTAALAQSSAGPAVIRPRDILRSERVPNLGSFGQPLQAAAASQGDTPATGPAKTKEYKFTTIDFPGAARSQVVSLNAGMASGYYYVGSWQDTQGFTFKGGTYRKFSLPNAKTTDILRSNSVGQVVGDFVDLAGKPHGYLYSAGVFTTIDYPGAQWTEAIGINDLGVVVGQYQDASEIHGFVYNSGHFTTIDFPGASYQTGVWDINLNGDCVGLWSDPIGGRFRGFRFSNGVFTSLNVPGSIESPAWGINDAGDIVGSYEDSNNIFHGYVYSGTFRTVDVPGALGTLWSDITNTGQLSGAFIDALGENHGVIGK